MKQELLNKIDILRTAIETEDIPSLLTCMKGMGFSGMSRGPICDYAHSLLVKGISAHIKKGKKLRVKRKGEYGIEMVDVYTVKDSVLMRNGTDTKWSSIGKLYQAYKQIHCITD